MIADMIQKLSSNINKSIEQQMVTAASAGKLTIMANKGGDKIEPYVFFFFWISKFCVAPA